VTPGVGHTVGVHDEIGVNVATAATTCGAFNTAGVGYIDINSTVPTG
jgi:hypothetical protein